MCGVECHFKARGVAVSPLHGVGVMGGEEDRRHVSRFHLLQRRRMGDERLLHLNAQAIEDQGTRIGSGRPWGVEVDLFAFQLVERGNVLADQDVRFRRKQVQHIGDAVAKRRHARLEGIERIGVDDRSIDSPQIEERVDVLAWAARDDRQHVQPVPIVDRSCYFRGESDRRTLELPRRKPDRARIDVVFLLGVGGYGDARS